MSCEGKCNCKAQTSGSIAANDAKLKADSDNRKYRAETERLKVLFAVIAEEQVHDRDVSPVYIAAWKEIKDILNG